MKKTTSMGSNHKDIPRINQVLRMLVKSKESQKTVANALGISSQSLGYYMNGRKIPTTVIEKWEQVFNQNLMVLAKMDFETDLDQWINNKFGPISPKDRRKDFDKRVEEEVITLEMWRQLQRDHIIFEQELKRAWDLIDRLLPQSKFHGFKRFKPDEGQ